MKQISVTITVGQGSERHNHDLNYRKKLEHVRNHGDDGVIELIPYNQSYEEQINQLMKPYIDRYNQRQQERYEEAWERYNTGQIKTKPRKRNYQPVSYDYYQEHKDDTYFNRATGQHEQLPIWRSVIIGLGDMNDRKSGVITEETAVTVLQGIADSWPELFPDFRLLGASLHVDEEGFYHAHFDYKPMYDNEAEKGLQVGIGQESALEHMGFEPEQSLINGDDKIPIRFNAFRNRLYLEVEKELHNQKINLQYGVSKVKDPGKDSSRNQRLENWQATQDKALELQLMKNKMIDIISADEASPEGIKEALEAFDSLNDTLHQIEEQPRSRLNKNNVVVHFELFDQLRSFLDNLINSVAYIIQQWDIANENLENEEKRNEELEQELEPLRQYGTNDFKMEYAAAKAKAQMYDSLKRENEQLRRQLGIENKKGSLQR